MMKILIAKKKNELKEPFEPMDRKLRRLQIEEWIALKQFEKVEHLFEKVS